MNSGVEASRKTGATGSQPGWNGRHPFRHQTKRPTTLPRLLPRQGSSFEEREENTTMKVGVLGAILISLVWLVCPPVGSAQSNDLEAAVQLEQQVVKLYAAGHFGEAIKLAVQILAIHEKVLGPEHPDTATSLNNLAVFYQSMGAYAQA